MEPDMGANVCSDVLEQVRFGSERHNTEECVVKMRGGVEWGDGKRLRVRVCDVLVGWESIGPVFCGILYLSITRGECFGNEKGSSCQNGGTCVTEGGGGVDGSLGSVGETVVWRDMVWRGRIRRESVLMNGPGGSVMRILMGKTKVDMDPGTFWGCEMTQWSRNETNDCNGRCRGGRTTCRTEWLMSSLPYSWTIFFLQLLLFFSNVVVVGWFSNSGGNLGELFKVTVTLPFRFFEKQKEDWRKLRDSSKRESRHHVSGGLWEKNCGRRNRFRCETGARAPTVFPGSSPRTTREKETDRDTIFQ